VQELAGRTHDTKLRLIEAAKAAISAAMKDPSSVIFKGVSVSPTLTRVCGLVNAKNYSIMIRGNGASLAPTYDVMCGEVWENVTKNLAQTIAGESRGDYLMGRHWQQFARESGLNPKQVIDRVGALAKAAIAEAAAAESEVAAMPAGGHAILGQTRHAVERRARALLAQLHDLGSHLIRATIDEGGTECAEGAEVARSDLE
jgi:hypothetical protein